MSGDKKILIITYYWPPCGGAGVQRWLKFVKYLPDFGWEPMVLTVDPKNATYPALDIGLENEIDSNIQVFKTPATDYFKLFKRKSGEAGNPSAGFAADDSSGFIRKLARFIRGNFFIPDPRRGWNSYAYKKACSLINDYGINYVITTSPPHSTQLIGLKLKKRFPHLKWIADFRDPWTDIYFYKMFHQSLPARIIDRRYEERVLRKADLILTVGESLTTLLGNKVEKPEKSLKTISNGYDEPDFAALKPTKKSDDFCITYVGTLSDQYPINGFLSAVKALIEDEGRRIILKIAGNISENQKSQILNILREENIEFFSYSDHRLSIQQMVDSNLLLLVIPNHPLNKLIITGKLFEYLRSGNPILCLGPENGDAAKIIKQSGAGRTFDYNNTEGIGLYISDLPITNPSQRETSKWDRKQITIQLSEILKLME